MVCIALYRTASNWRHTHEQCRQRSDRPDFYDLDISPDGLSSKGFSQSYTNTWRNLSKGKSQCWLKRLRVWNSHLKARDNKEMAAFAAAAAAIARIRDDKARAEVKMHHFSMFGSWR